jgi:LexA DNA binding domain
VTPRERNVLSYVLTYLEDHGGISPSYEEIAAGVGLSNKSHAHQAVHQLINKGHLVKAGGGGARVLCPPPASASCYAPEERAAVWFLLRERESKTLKEIVADIISIYAASGVDAGGPADLTPDDVTLWLAACWRDHGLHTVHYAAPLEAAE